MIHRATLTLDNRLTGPEAVIAINAMAEFAASETAEIREALAQLLHQMDVGGLADIAIAIHNAKSLLTATKIVTDGADGVE